MALDVSKMAKRHEAAKEERSSGDYFEPKMGFTKLFVHPPCRPDDEFELTAGLNFLEYKIHYDVNGKTVISLDTEQNPLLLHPFVQEYLNARGIVIDPEKPCPVTEWLKAQTPEQKKESKIQSRYIWGVTAIAYAEKKGAWKPSEIFKPSAYPCSFTVWDGIMGKLTEDPKYDPTDIDKATFVVLHKEKKNPKGKDDNKNVKYSVDFDVETTRKPAVLSKAQRTALENAMEAGGDCDLFRVFANMVKTYEEVQAACDGIELDDEDKARIREEGREAAAARVSVDADEEPAAEEEAEVAVEEDEPAADEEEAEEVVEEEAAAEGEGEAAAEEEPAAEEAAAIEVPEGAPECYGLDIEQEHPTCQACPFKAQCAEVMGTAVPPDPAPKKAPPKAPAKPAPVAKPGAAPVKTATATKPATAAPAKAGAPATKPAATGKPGAGKPATAANGKTSPKAPPKAPAAEPEGLDDIEAELEKMAGTRTAAKTATARAAGKK